MTPEIQEMNTPERLAGVTLDTLLAATQAAAVQAEILFKKHPDSDVLDQVRLEFGHLYEMLRYETEVWRMAGELDR